MTNQEPGRELDAAVWLVLNGRKPNEPCRHVDGDIQPHAGYPIGHISPPEYTTNMAAAWHAVERLAANNYRVWLHHQEDKWTFDIEPVEPGRGFPNYRIIRKTSDTAPHAICLAAVAAMEKG